MSKFKLIKGGAIEPPTPDEALSALKARVASLETDAAVTLGFRIVYVGAGERQVPIALLPDEIMDEVNVWAKTISVPEARASALAFLLYLANRRMR